jgi:hypothetical protein
VVQKFFSEQYFFHPTFRHWAVVVALSIMIIGIYLGKTLQAGAMIVLLSNAVLGGACKKTLA